MKKFTLFLGLLACLGFISKEAPAQKKPILYVPLGQSELAYNLVKECSTIEITWILEKADLVVSWGMNEKRAGMTGWYTRLMDMSSDRVKPFACPRRRETSVKRSMGSKTTAP
jgi:hypothetical protein